jgi:hypothetical protein
MKPITIDLGAAGVARLSAAGDDPLTLEIFTDGNRAVVIKQAFVLERLVASITAARTARARRTGGDVIVGEGAA